jgi:Zn finger protein HypA/HybF involved in hydrogenase expression
MDENSKIQKTQSELISQYKEVEKTQCICSKCNEPYERLAFEEYCHNCIQEIMGR